MNLKEAKVELLEHHTEVTPISNVYRLQEAFQVFIQSTPSRDEFDAYIHSIPLTAGMLYDLTIGREG